MRSRFWFSATSLAAIAVFLLGIGLSASAEISTAQPSDFPPGDFGIRPLFAKKPYRQAFLSLTQVPNTSNDTENQSMYHACFIVRHHESRKKSVQAVTPDEGDNKKWRLSAGAFLPIDVPAGIDTREGYTFSIGGKFLDSQTGYLLGSLRYSRYVASGGRDIGLLNPMLEYHWRFGGDQRFYAGPGIGLIFGHNIRGRSSSSFAYSLTVGINFSSFFLEASWRRGNKDGEHGIIAEAGIRF